MFKLKDGFLPLKNWMSIKFERKKNIILEKYVYCPMLKSAFYYKKTIPFWPIEIALLDICIHLLFIPDSTENDCLYFTNNSQFWLQRKFTKAMFSLVMKLLLWKYVTWFIRLTEDFLYCQNCFFIKPNKQNFFAFGTSLEITME